MSVDLRTRTDVAPTEPFDVAAFFDEHLPAALLALEALPEGLGTRALRTLVVTVEDRDWTLDATDGRPRIRAGRPADPASVRAEVRLDEGQVRALALDLLTPIAFMTSGTLDMPTGGLHHLMDWWLVLRSAVDASTWVDVDTARSELPEDLQRSFSLDDDPAEIRSFLERAGFVHLRSVFTDAEMAQVSADMDAAAPTYAQGDGRSWWAKTVDGDRLVRMEHFDEHSPTTASLLDDPRFLAIGALPGDGHCEPTFGGNRIEALFKPIGVTEGISDIPWHKDCSLGRHSYDCCRLTVGISVTGGGPTTGQLRVIAGSHRVLVWPALLDVATTGLPEVQLPTETGDVTVHLSCTLHMAEPPTGAERRVMYTSFRQPEDAAAVAGHAHMVAVARESAPLMTSQPSTV